MYVVLERTWLGGSRCWVIMLIQEINQRDGDGCLGL